VDITKVKHSESKPAWNVIGTTLGGKHKIARVPYVVIMDDDEKVRKVFNEYEKQQAHKIARFISRALNKDGHHLC